MFDRSMTRPAHTRLGHVTLLFAAVIGVFTLSLFFASATDVRAMMRPDQAAARAAHKPVEMPEEWVWRGPASKVDSMYGDRPAPRRPGDF